MSGSKSPQEHWCIGRLIGPDGEPLTQFEMFDVGPSNGDWYRHRQPNAQGMFWLGPPEEAPWRVYVTVLRPDGVRYNHQFEDLRPGGEVLDLHVTGERSVFLRLHPAGRTDEPLLVNEYTLHTSRYGIGHVGPPLRAGGLMYWWARDHPAPTLEDACLDAPGYRPVHLGSIDLSQGVVVLDVELEPVR